MVTNAQELEQVAIQEKLWTIEDSEKLYRISGWGEPYFAINSAGNVTVSPMGDRGGSLDLYQLICHLYSVPSAFCYTLIFA